MKNKEYDPDRKWVIEVTEKQLYQIINCVEDIHRFLCGEMELDHATSFIKDSYKMHEMREKLGELQPYMTPELSLGARYKWSGGLCPNKYQRDEIAATYAIYRNLRHCIELYRDRDDWNVYQSETLTCGFPLATCWPKEIENYD